MMKFQIILANFCVLVVNFTFIYGFPVPLSLPKDNAKQIQKHNRVNGADKKKPKDSKTKLRIEEWQRIMNNIDPGKLQKIGDNHYGLTGASADIQNDILRRIIENHLKKLRKVTAKNSLKPSGIKTNAKKDSGANVNEHTDESALHSKNEKGKKQKKIDFTIGPQKSIGDEYSTTNRQSDDEKTESEATTLKAEGTTPKLIEIVAYPSSYTKSMSSTLTSSASAPSSSSTFALTSTSTSSSSQSLSSSSTMTFPSSSSSASTSSSSSLSSQTTGKTSSSSSTSLSFSKYSTTASSTTSSSGTFFQTQSESSSLSSSLSSTSSISLTSSSSLLWTLISSQTSSSTASSVSSVSSLITASSSSTSSETSVPLSPSLLPQPHILHIKLVNNKTSDNR